MFIKWSNKIIIKTKSIVYVNLYDKEYFVFGKYFSVDINKKNVWRVMSMNNITKGDEIDERMDGMCHQDIARKAVQMIYIDDN